MKYPNGKDTMPMATTTLGKWGNSSAIRIPNHLLKQLNIEEGAEMEILLTPDNELLLRPTTRRQDSNEDLRAHLKSLLSEIKPDSPRHEEINLGREGDELI